MYYPYFLTYIVTGLILSLAVFWWALKNGQFRDQERARYLPLEDQASAPAKGLPGPGRLEVLALAGLVAAGLALSAAVLIVSLVRFGSLT